MVVRLCARISGSMGRKLSPPGMKRPVNTALPMLAEMPHRNVAAPLYAHPRTGCFLLSKKLVQSFRIESHHHIVADDDSRRGTAAIFINEVLNSGGILTDVAVLECYASRREVRRGDLARRSARLREDDDLFSHFLAGPLLF